MSRLDDVALPTGQACCINKPIKDAEHRLLGQENTCSAVVESIKSSNSAKGFGTVVADVSMHFLAVSWPHMPHSISLLHDVTCYVLWTRFPMSS